MRRNRRGCRWRSLGFAQGWVAQSHESRGGPDSGGGRGARGERRRLRRRLRRIGTAAGVVALASVGVGVGTLNDWSRHKSAVFNHVRAVRLSCANRRGADSAVIDRQPAAPVHVESPANLPHQPVRGITPARHDNQETKQRVL